MQQRKYNIEWSLICVSILLVLISVISDHFTNNYNWFSRSGSIIVLISVIIEFRVSSHIYDDFQRAQYQQQIIDMPIPIKANTPKNRKNLLIVTHTLLFFGTLIWGYGGLIWS